MAEKASGQTLTIKRENKSPVTNWKVQGQQNPHNFPSNSVEFGKATQQVIAKFSEMLGQEKCLSGAIESLLKR